MKMMTGQRKTFSTKVAARGDVPAPINSPRHWVYDTPLSCRHGPEGE